MYKPNPLYVLCALLALLSLGSCFLPSPPTVPDHVFDAYVKQYDGMARMVVSEERKAGRVYGNFEQMKVLLRHTYETSVKTYYDRAQLLKLWSDLVVEDIEEMKAGLIMEVEDISREEAMAKEYKFEDKRRWTDMDITNGYFKTLDDDGKAAELEHILQVHRGRLFSGEILFAHRDSLHLVGVYDLESGLHNQTWEEYFFKDRPPISALYELEHWEYQVRSAEKVAVDYLYAKFRTQFYVFDGLRAAIVPKTYTVRKGETFEAEIVLGAYNAFEYPEVEANGRKLTEQNKGVTFFHEKAVTPGRKKVKGAIYIHHPLTGERVPFPFETEYEVVE